MMEWRQVTFNGVTLFERKPSGADHPILQEVDGLIDGATWQAPSGQRVSADGAWAGIPRRAPRGGSLSGQTISSDPLSAEAWADRLEAAGVGKDLPCTFHYASGPRTLFVRVDGAIRRRRRDVGDEHSVEWQIPLVADDPAFYIGDGITPAWSGTTGKAYEVGGVTFPISFPLSWDSEVVSGQLAYVNPGTTGRVQFRLDGPLTDPVITSTNSDGVRTLSWNITIPEGGFLLVDPSSRQALLQGQASRPPVQRGWPRLTGGQNHWRFHASGDSSGTLTAQAWAAY